MRRVLRLLGWLIGAVATLAVIFWLLPRERVVMGVLPVIDDPASFLAEREGAFDDIRPGDAARIIWAGAAGAVTPLSILYLHGFSAGPEEIRPVPDDVARAWCEFGLCAAVGPRARWGGDGRAARGRLAG